MKGTGLAKAQLLSGLSDKIRGIGFFIVTRRLGSSETAFASARAGYDDFSWKNEVDSSPRAR
jgi:hypothetical protein